MSTRCLSVRAITIATSLLIFAVSLLSAQAQLSSKNPLRDRIKQRIQERLRQQQSKLIESPSSIPVKEKIAGLDVAVWKPASFEKPSPLIVFSHGFHGFNAQTAFLMDAFAKQGYLVLAPNHKDAAGNGTALSAPQQAFRNADSWTDANYKDRCDDIKNLIEALRKNPNWKEKIDWSKLALAGHSLGGYTVLGLAGAWTTWKLNGVKAVLALSPYCQPYVLKGNLDKLQVPVMYQCGTRDFGVTPFLKRPGGAYNKTSAPACLVEFDKANHFAWSNLNKDQKQRDLITHYSLAFMNKYLAGQAEKTEPPKKLAGVTTLECK